MKMRRGLRLLALILALGPLASAAMAQNADLAALQTAAEAGDPAALTALADRYYAGQGVLQDFAQAAALYARAAETGLAEAQNRLGRQYHTGLGVPRDPATALRWFEAAAAQGAPQHLFDLASVLEETGAEADLTRAADLYARAAQAGLAEAAVSLGVLYQDGRGVAQDYARAFELYSAAAETGHARAQNNLGLLYVRGHGVPQDYPRAVALFEAAAQAGLAQAMTNLGVMYANGFGVPQSDAEAARLYRLGGRADAEAANLPQAVYDPRLTPVPSEPEAQARIETAAQAGDPVAQFQMGWVLAEAGAGHTEWQAAARLFRAGAAKGHGAAMANLGLLYMHGRGVPQDYVLGQMWLVLAGSAGFEGAPELSATARGRMTAGQINDAQRRAAAYWETQRSRPDFAAIAR